MSTNALRVGLVGGGVVGGGVYILLKRNNDRLYRMHGIKIDIVRICVQDLQKERDFLETDEEKALLTTDFDDILNDSSINCVVEVMGGITDAQTVQWTALHRGKHVVTANKALIASQLDTLKEILKNNPLLQYGMEAAVCGGIPIIHALQTDFPCDFIQSMSGIMNGTTNFMLSKMEDEHADYSAVLKEAQRLGFAEADPTADVEGHDVRAKIAILAKLAFGQTIALDDIPTVGISSLSAIDFTFAGLLQSTIKLLGNAVIDEKSGFLSVFVSPTIVPYSSPLSAVKGAGNMVLAHSENLQCSIFAGPGAGRFPTANSVVNDLVRIAQGKALSSFPREESVKVVSDYEKEFFVRVSVHGQVAESVFTEAAGQLSISIRQILQQANVERNVTHFALLTRRVFLTQILTFVESIKTSVVVCETPVFLPLL